MQQFGSPDATILDSSDATPEARVEADIGGRQVAPDFLPSQPQSFSKKITHLVMTSSSMRFDQYLKAALGQLADSSPVKDLVAFVQSDSASAEYEPKIYSDCVYFNYYALGFSLMFAPQSSYKPRLPLALNMLRLQSIDVYNAKGSVARGTPYSTFPALPIDVFSLENTSLTVENTTTGKEFVHILGEPSRKGGGTGASSGSIDIWCEWTKLGLMVEFQSNARGLQPWEQGKDAIWKALTVFIA